MTAAAEHCDTTSGHNPTGPGDVVRTAMGLALGVALAAVVGGLVILTVGRDAFPAIPGPDAPAPYYVGQ